MIFSLIPPLTLLSLICVLEGVEVAVTALCAFAISTGIAGLCLSVWLRRSLPAPQEGSVGFFHPFADSGGGGERVLWCAIQALQGSRPAVQVLLYCRAGASAANLCDLAASSFGIPVEGDFEVVGLQKWDLILPKRWPRWTMLLQAAGSVWLCWEGMQKAMPEVMIDTSGWAFMYPLLRLAGVRVVCYTHYPTISTDMLKRVHTRQAAFNNDNSIAGSTLKSAAKLVYYYMFASLYGAVGACANVVMVNSSWTQAHISSLWLRLGTPQLVYPPCNTTSLSALPLDRKLKSLYLVSLAQFRPEKNHAKQLRAFALAQEQAARAWSPASEAVLAARLKIIGSCRDQEDHDRVDQLEEMAAALGIAEKVDFCVNASALQVRELLGGAVGGLHSMVDEHFGISVVEYMAAGTVPIAHNSGGPMMDIVVPCFGEEGEAVGFRCESDEEYAHAMNLVLSMEQSHRLQMAAAARRKSTTFCDKAFQEGFLSAIGPELRRIQSSCGRTYQG
ncbi:hypothetical protein CVIRNUC_007426 [Coccomyxa viridis]|uniref:GDP-Man:Man(3)GlcNAc(2)-PP-Dol alpha-1,2-mannosyltransferase n=1 Tax=Coccomyxa viridis TaxID=1274662 RepID=A0AAV1IBZ1_9CHLO|nr:hypothetical protein CVIRNUC_007426 [Coccomyxa viridis]